MIDTDVINPTIDRALHTVLVVDDNPATRYATARVLLRAPASRHARPASGHRGARRSSAQGVSAVVLDVHLPDIDGFEVCRLHPRAGRPRPCCRWCTCRPPTSQRGPRHRPERRRRRLPGAPVEPAVLVATMQALIRARMAEEQLRRSEAALPRDLRRRAQRHRADRRGRALRRREPRAAPLLGRAQREPRRPRGQRFRANRWCQAW